VKPLRLCIEDREKAIAEAEKAKPLENRTQALMRNDRNIVSLIKMVCTEWFSAEYRIVSVVDLNAIEFGRWSEFKSVHDILGAYRHLIVDARFISRKRESKMREYDEQILVEMMRTVAVMNDVRVLVLLPGTLKPVNDAYPGLLKGWNELGEFYYAKGRIGKFPTEDTKANDEE
jgi:hypothetical protein